jgi:hypothetical protein
MMLSDALTGELERMRVAQLVWREAAPDPGAGGAPAELGPDRRRLATSPVAGFIPKGGAPARRQLTPTGPP